MVEQNALRKIKPSKNGEERVKKFVKKLVKTAESVSNLNCLPCGSIGKGTWLSGDHDIDLFMIFPRNTSRATLEKHGLAFGKKIAKNLKGKHIIKYAEHPYTQITASGFTIDVVPCYKIKRHEKIISAVDRSPLHLEFVKEKLSRPDEARLLKQFCKGIGVYGSDTKTEGFSGYICELFIIAFGSFKKLIKEASNWQPPVLLELVKKEKKFSDSLIVIDPIDSNRNVAAVISDENFIKFISAAKQYTKKPTLSFFFPPNKKTLSTTELNILKKRGTHFITIVMKRPDILDDIVYPQLRRSLRRINSLLHQHEFFTIRSFVFSDNKKMVIILEVENEKMPAVEKMTGPTIYSKKHTKEFLTKYGSTKNIFGPFIENGRWVVEKPREHKTAFDLIKSFVSSKKLEEKGIPKNIATHMKKSKILENSFSLFKKDKNLSVAIREKYFKKLI
ncbi:CCA tRNA nucleotidyltransferase [Candidatus Aenigmatarchaeota archaeon]